MIIEDVDYKYKNCFIYKIKEGDTKDLLCENLNIDIASINTEVIKAGKAIFVDRHSVFTYVVKPLDSFSSIAKLFNTSVDKIKKLNDIENLFIGQKLLIEK